MALLNFNQNPYFDDFNSSKNYVKILFKSGVPVQGRELNQIQSIFQNQITQFANNIFKNGSVISGGRNSMKAQNYVRLMPFVTGSSTQAVNVTQFTEGYKLTGATSGVTALLVTGFNTDTAGDPPTIYVVYTGTGLDGTTKTFIPGEVLNWIDSNGLVVYNTTVRCPGCVGSTITDTIPPLGQGQIYTIDDGVFYYEGMFLSVSRQMYVVTPYLVKKVDAQGNVVIDDTTLSDGTIPPTPRKIGLDLVQNIVTYQTDQSLLDPSLGYPNSSAPGADRYQCQLILNSRGYTDSDGDSFIPLCLLGSNMSIQYQNAESEYNTIQGDIAQQFYETNGNYTLAPFKISFYQSQKGSTTDAQGWSSAGSASDLICLVQPSIAYVNGYRQDITTPTPIQFPKARSTNNIRGFINQFPERTYIVLQPTSTKIWPNDNADQTMMGTRQLSLVNASNVVVATCYVNDIKLHKTITGGAQNQYRYYIYDLQIVAGHAISEVTQATTDTTFTSTAIADPVSGKFTVYNPNMQALIFPVNKTNVASLRDTSNNQNGSFQVTLRQKLTGVLDANGNITFSAATNQAFLASDAFTLIYVVIAGVYHPVDPSITGVYSTTGTTLTISTAAAGGGTAWGSGSIYVMTSVLYTSQKEEQKVLTAGTYNTTVEPTFTLGAVVNLPVSDVQNFTVIWKQYNGTNTDITSEYVLDNGLTDYSYSNCSLTRISGASTAETNVNVADRLQITYNYYTWNGPYGWFTVDSYPVDPNINSSAISNPVLYENLPVYTLSTQAKIPASQAIDFRPQLPSPLVEGVTSVKAMLPAMQSTSVFDISYYQARTDLLEITKDGVLFIKMGTPSDTPIPPVADPNAMGLWQIVMKPYVYSLADVTTKFIENKVFTMTDIGHLESRISNLEYYTALNLLEQSASSMQVTDSTGLSRFKNGFIVDNFSDFQAADLLSPEFRAAADPHTQELRPQFKTRNKKLVVDKTNSSGFTFLGNVAIANYTELALGGNSYATQSISINPFLMFDQSGTMQLSPNNDTWSDDTTLPAVQVAAGAGADAFTQLTSPTSVLGTSYSSWTQQNTTILGTTTNTATSGFKNIVQGSAGASTTLGTITNTGSSTNNTTTTQTSGKTTVASTTQSYSINAVQNVSIIPYARSIPIQFYAQKMRPSTKVFAFFNGVNVSAYCRPLGLQWTSASAITQGVQLVTDTNGECMGVFTIPANTFFTGTLSFKLSDDASGASDPSIETTEADADFFSGGLDLTMQSKTMNIVSPTSTASVVTKTIDTTATSTQATTNTTSVTTSAPPVAPAQATPAPASKGCYQHFGFGMNTRSTRLQPYECYCMRWPGMGYCYDPVAQAFQTTSEMFLSSIGIYFEQIDPAAPNLYVEIRTMDNGFPSGTVLVHKAFTLTQLQAWARAARGPGSLPYSADSTVEAKITFDTPVYLESSTLYCFVIGGVSPNTRVWEAYLGKPVVNNPSQIVQVSPTGEPSFRSLNGTTWNAQQFETLKYNLYQAQFQTGTLKLTMKQSALDDEANTFGTWPLQDNPLQMQSGSNQVRVFARDHGFTEGDTFNLSMQENVQLTYTATGTTLSPPQATQLLVAGSSQASIQTVESTAVANQYLLTLKNVSGDFNMGNSTNTTLAVSSPAVLGVTARDPSVAIANGSLVDLTTGWTLNAASGTIAKGGSSSVTNNVGTIFLEDNFGGVVLSQLNTSHSIVTVDSQDSFIIQVTTPANFTGNLGGSNAACLSFNEKYDIFNVAGSYLSYNSTESWTLTGLGYGRVGSPFRSQDNQILAPVGFVPGNDTYLAQPQKYVSNNQNSITILGTFNNSSVETSPIINLDTFSVTTVSNRCEVITAADMTLAPVVAGDPYFVSETDPTNVSGGSETYKYVTQNVVLANPASDLMIYFDVYHDINADFDVYVKVLTVNSSSTIDQVPWMLVDGINKAQYSTDLNDFIEYSVTASSEISTWVANTSFTALKVKIVGRSWNSSMCPLFKSFRAIAVT